MSSPMNVSQREIDFLVRINAMPEDVANPDPEDFQAVAAHDLYLFAINTGLLFKISHIDEPDGVMWIEINFENEDGRDEFHTIAVDEDIHRKAGTESYKVPVYTFDS